MSKGWYQLHPAARKAVVAVVKDAASRARQYAIQYPLTAKEHEMLAEALEAAAYHLAEPLKIGKKTTGDKGLEMLIELGKVGLAGALIGGVDGARLAVTNAITSDENPSKARRKK